MAIISTSELPPGTAASVDNGGRASWSNPDYAKTDDTSYATCALQTGPPAGADYLVLTNFGFTLPVGATILGVTVTPRCGK